MVDSASSERSSPVVCRLYDTVLVGLIEARDRRPTAGHAERLCDSLGTRTSDHVTIWERD